MEFRARPYQRGIVAVAIACAVVLALSTTFAATAPPLTRLSFDPFNNPTAEHQTEVESTVSASGNTIVAAFQQGRFLNGGSTDIGFASSQTGGHTWTSGSLPGITTSVGGPYASVTNPVVAFDAKHHVWQILTVGLDSYLAGVALVVNQSTDGGVTWSMPATVAKAQPGQSWDKPWIVCDNTTTSPFYGHCYVQWDDNSASQLISMSTSTDGGLTWGPGLHTADLATGIAGQPVVQPNGRVIVPYVANVNTVLPTAMLSFQSTNGGATWSSRTTIASPVQTHQPAPGFGIGLRLYTLPSAAIDGAGTVYVVWQECNFESNCAANDLVLATSTNGATWSATKRIPIDPVGSGTDHFLPGLAADATTLGASAHLGLVFYYYPVANCTMSTCQLDVGYASSTTGGQTWTTKTQIGGPMTLSELAPSNLGPMVGDYISTAIMNHMAYPVFAVGQSPAGTGARFNEAMFTVTGGLPVGAGSNPVSVPSVWLPVVPRDHALTTGSAVPGQSSTVSSGALPLPIR